MDTLMIFKVAHSLTRWAVVLFGLLAIIGAIRGMILNRPYSNSDNKMGLLFMIFCDIQLLIGLGLFFGNGWFDKIKSGMGNVMKNAYDRFFTVEHALIMIVAWILVHVGRTAVKKAPESSKHKKALIFFGIAFMLIMASIPWPFRQEIAQPLFRWFN